jgi:hydroxymethylbilane synthase
VQAGDFDATLLALSGLRRLGLERHARCLLDPWETPSACGQGALAITARADDAEALAWARAIEDRAARLEVTCERAFLSALDGSCRTPIGGLARWEGGMLRFAGEALTPDGAHVWRREGERPCASPEQAEALGEALGREVRAEAGDRLSVG